MRFLRALGLKKTKPPKKPVHKESPPMKIALVSESKNALVTPDVMRAVAGACERQLFENYAPFFQRAGIVLTYYASIQDVPADESPLVVFDQSDEPGALGYHTVTPTGLPYGKVFVRPIVDSGGKMTETANSLSVTVSHEVLEAVGDPYVDLWADVDGEWEDAYELCDRTEGDSYTLGSGDFGDVALSNFLGPRAFRDGDGPYDWMGLLKQPFEVRPGGYCVRRKGGPSGTTKQIFGEEHPEWKQRHRRANPSSRMNVRSILDPGARAARLAVGGPTSRSWLNLPKANGRG